MVDTMSPVVYKGKTAPWLVGGIIFLLANVGSAAVVGAIIGWAGEIALPFQEPTSIMLIVTAVIALLYSLRDLGVLWLPRIQWKRQVPVGWRYRMHPVLVAFLYGVQLGPGVFVLIYGSAFYAMVTGLLILGSPMAGATIFSIYALMRAAFPVFVGRNANSVSDLKEAVFKLAGVSHVQIARGALLLAGIGGFNLGILL